MPTSKIQQTVTFLKTNTALIKGMPGYLKAKTAVRASRLIRLDTTLFYRQKRSFLSATIVALSIIVGLVLLVEAQRIRIKKELSRKAASIAKQLPEKEAAHWMVRGRSERSDWQAEARSALQEITKQLMANETLRYASIVDDKSQQIKSHSTESWIGKKDDSISGEEIFQGEQTFIARRSEDRDQGGVIDFYFPIFYGQKDDRKRIGSLHLGFSSERLDNIEKRERILPLFSFLILVTFIAGVLFKDRVEQRKHRPVPSKDEHRLGPYLLERKIASGGMGELFVAIKESEGIRRKVAVKRILPEKANDEQVLSALVDEASLSGQLHHPNIVTLHDFRNIDGTYILDMEYVEGVDLSILMKRCGDRIQIKHALYIVSDVCKGLDYAHQKKDDFSGQPLLVVHRDISPTNILISMRGEIKITDFGIAKAAQRVSKHTEFGVIKGKLYYLSPEQATGGEIDHRSDLFSLGLVLYELLAAEKAFPGNTTHEILMFVARAEVKPIGRFRKILPVELERMVMKSLERDQSKRHQSAKELLDEIDAFIRANLEYKCDSSEIADLVQECFNKK